MEDVLYVHYYIRLKVELSQLEEVEQPFDH